MNNNGDYSKTKNKNKNIYNKTVASNDNSQIIIRVV